MAFAIARTQQVTTRTLHAPSMTVDSPSEVRQEPTAAARSALDRAAQPRPAWPRLPRTRPARDPMARDPMARGSTERGAQRQRAPEVARPAPVMTFDRLADSAGSRAGTQTKVTPRLRPAARLDVASPAHGQVRVWGLARFFPAHTIHAQRSTAVVAGNNCRLQSVDHYHVHRVSVSLDPLLTDRPASRALERLLEAPTDSGRIADLQREARRLSTATPDRGPTHSSMQVRPSHVTSIMSSTAVQQGDGSRMNVVSRYVVEESVLPIVDLLAADEGLVRSLAQSLLEHQPGTGRAAFLRELRRVSADVDDLALLDHATDLETRDTWFASLLGLATVSNASAVLVGSGNELVTGMRLDHPSLRRADVLADLAQLRREVDVPVRSPDTEPAAPMRAHAFQPAPAPPPAGQTRLDRPPALPGLAATPTPYRRRRPRAAGNAEGPAWM
jgi:hypothetical protein